MSGRQPLLHDLAIALCAPTVVLSGQDGQLRGDGTQGVLHGDLRVLSEAVVTVDGREPEPIGTAEPAAERGDFTGLLRHLGDPGPDPTVWLRRHRTVTATGMTEEIELVSTAGDAHRCTVELTAAADFAPIELIKDGGSREAVAPEPAGGDTVRWSCGGVTSTLRADGAAVTVRSPRAVARWTVDLPPASRVRLGWEVTAADPEALFVHGDAVRLGAPEVQADDRRFTSLLRRSLTDLEALLLAERDHPEDVFVGAGAPWYLTLFGRDSIWAARLLLPVSVRLAAGTLRTLARAQGTAFDPATGEAPGKIMHERRRDGFELTGMSLPALYYGTVDATALWVCLLHDAWRWGLPEDEVRALLPNLRAALEWITEHSDTDGDGFAEYLDESGRGLANQGWKDSGDAVRFADGSRARPPVALAEVQGYQYEAALKGAALLTAFGEDPGGLEAWAGNLARRFRERFWVGTQEAGYPALALDGDKAVVDAPTSNMGHLLGTGLVDTAESERIGARLLGGDLAAGFGLRTMSSAVGGYSALSYHCGSVWPHDTAIVVRGLADAGQPERAAELGMQLVRAAGSFGDRLPELFAGYGSEETPVPVPYPASCRPQAWSAAAAVALLSAFLGLRADVPAGTVTLAPPRPSPVGALRVSGLPLAGGTLDVAVDRDGTVTEMRLPPGLRPA